MVERKEYIDELIGWKDEQVIKVVTGIRRCGKSTLLAQYQTWLKENGIADAQIVSINFEELEYEELLNYKKLYAYLKERLIPEKNTYIFLDEIQKVADFEKVVDSLYVKPNVDIYITGSNAYMLSGDLATLLTGRYVEIKMLPLSLKEFLTITGMDEERGFAEYLKCGGLPYVARMGRTTAKVETYLEGIYNTVIVKDIEDRQVRRESEPSKRKITDIETVLVILVFYSNQSLGGGFHASSHTKCFLVMCAGMMIALLILCCELSDLFFMAMALLSYILLYVKPLILHPHKAYLAYNSTMYTQRSRIAVSLELLFFIFFSVTGLTLLNEALSAGMALSVVSRIFAFALRHGKAQ